MKKHNFTLVEILGVTALLVILMVIGIGVYSYALDSSKEKATHATITRLNNALQLLQDKGLMQRTLSVSNVVYANITVDVSNSRIQFGSNTAIGGETYKRFMQAMDADSINSILNGSNQISDAWGQAIFVRYPGKFNKGSFDIISAGSDGAYGEAGASAPYNGSTDTIARYKDGSDLICDDIANFL